MNNRPALRLVAEFLCLLLAACGPSIPTNLLSPSDVGTRDTADLPADSSYGMPAPLRRGFSPDAMHPTLVNAREFRLPGKDRTQASIIVGPDGNLWFTELRHIGTMSTSGQLIHDRLLKPTQEIPGALTNRHDGYIWANVAEALAPRCRCPKCARRCTLPPQTEADRQGWTEYQLFKISTAMDIHTIFLPPTTFSFPTNLVRMGTDLYTGLTTSVWSHGSVVTDVVDHVSESGDITTLFSVPGIPSYLEPSDFIRTLATPDKKLWFYDYRGDIHGCQLDGHCTLTQLAHPELYVGSLQGTLTEYSPADHDVHVCTYFTSTIYSVSLSGKRAGAFRNPEIGRGFCALLYYHHDIWVTLNGDSQLRPMLGRLTPDGQFSLISLPFHGGYEVGAMTEGPDGHLWYLRGRAVGEILSGV